MDKIIRKQVVGNLKGIPAEAWLKYWGFAKQKLSQLREQARSAKLSIMQRYYRLPFIPREGYEFRAPLLLLKLGIYESYELIQFILPKLIRDLILFLTNRSGVVLWKLSVIKDEDTGENMLELLPIVRNECRNTENNISIHNDSTHFIVQSKPDLSEHYANVFDLYDPDRRESIYQQNMVYYGSQKWISGKLYTVGIKMWYAPVSMWDVQNGKSGNIMWFLHDLTVYDYLPPYWIPVPKAEFIASSRHPFTKHTVEILQDDGTFKEYTLTDKESLTAYEYVSGGYLKTRYRQHKYEDLGSGTYIIGEEEPQLLVTKKYIDEYMCGVPVVEQEQNPWFKWVKSVDYPNPVSNMRDGTGYIAMADVNYVLLMTGGHNRKEGTGMTALQEVTGAGAVPGCIDYNQSILTYSYDSLYDVDLYFKNLKVDTFNYTSVGTGCEGNVFYSDYVHHPDEVSCSLSVTYNDRLDTMTDGGRIFNKAIDYDFKPESKVFIMVYSWDDRTLITTSKTTINPGFPAPIIETVSQQEKRTRCWKIAYSIDGETVNYINIPYTMNILSESYLDAGIAYVSCHVNKYCIAYTYLGWRQGIEKRYVGVINIAIPGISKGYHKEWIIDTDNEVDYYSRVKEFIPSYAYNDIGAIGLMEKKS